MGLLSRTPTANTARIERHFWFECPVRRTVRDGYVPPVRDTTVEHAVHTRGYVPRSFVRWRGIKIERTELTLEKTGSSSAYRNYRKPVVDTYKSRLLFEKRSSGRPSPPVIVEREPTLLEDYIRSKNEIVRPLRV